MKKSAFLLFFALFSFIVKGQNDVVPPFIACYGGIELNLPPDCEVDVPYADLVKFISDDISPSHEIEVSMRRKGYGTGFPLNPKGQVVRSLKYTGSDIGNRTIEIWVRDKAKNTSFCNITIVLKKHNFSCLSGSKIKIKVKNAQTSAEIEGALAFVNLKDSEKQLDWDMTDFQGNASLFLDSSASGAFRAEVQKMTDPLKGLTTFDLAKNMDLIRQHITGAKPFTQNWQYIAADMDRNNRIDSADIIACRKAVLGFTNDTLPLWRFYPETHVFPKPDPLSEPIPQGYDFLSTAIPLQTLVFMGVEMCRVEAQTSNTKDPSQRIEASIVPNPSAGATYLQFYSPDYESVIFETIDASGRSVFRQSMDVNSGQVQIEIPAEALPSPGIYFWRLAVRDKSAAGKIIRNE